MPAFLSDPADGHNLYQPHPEINPMKTDEGRDFPPADFFGERLTSVLRYGRINFNLKFKEDSFRPPVGVFKIRSCENPFRPQKEA